MSTTHELAGILEAAAQTLEVSGGGPLARGYTAEDYRQALLEVRQHYAPERKLALSACELEVGDQDALNNLLSFLRRALQEHIHEDRIQTAVFNIYGGPTSGREISGLAKKLLQLTMVYGSGQTAATFMDSLGEPRCAFRAYTLLGGVKVEAPVELYDGVRLVLLPSSGELPGFLPFMFRPGVESLHGATLISEDLSASPRYMNPQIFLAEADTSGNTPFEIQHQSTDMPNFSASEFCKALSLASRTRVFPSVSWQFVSEDEVANCWATFGGYGWMRDPEPDMRRTVTAPTLQQAKHVYESLTSMSPDDRDRLAVPVDRLIASWDAKGQVDQIIDLAIALESLYLPDGGGELSYRLRIRAARYLKTGLPERKELASHLGALYKARSKAVHTGKIPDEHKIGDRRENTKYLIHVTQDFCLGSILRVLDGGVPDWETVELA